MNANLSETLRRRLEKSERNQAEYVAAAARQKGDIASLLDHLGQLVEADGEGESKTNWGRVGSLGYVRGKLIEAVQHLSGLDETDIENALAEMRQ